MNTILILTSFLLYLLLLFWVAHRTEVRSQGGRSLVRNPWVYSLSLAVYCTAWTYYGSVGKAATSGIGFLPTYLGPTLMAPLWWFVLRKMILISKHQRLSSLADFISARYGKSTWLGIIATIVALFSIIPYISIQLKAITLSFQILSSHSAQNAASYLSGIGFIDDPAMYITLALTIFTIFFGTRKLDPNERHEGLVAAVAFESVIKLAAFLAVGIFIVYGLHGGFQPLFAEGAVHEEIRQLFTLEGAGLSGASWFWLTMLSMFAILLLPRQFHIGVVENADHRFLRKASWVFPLYLLLINLFVLPIAVAGLLRFPNGIVDPDTFVLSLPLVEGADGLALLVAIGGFSAATSMVIVAVIALSIMINNNLVLPLLFRYTNQNVEWRNDYPNRLIGIRRVSIVFVMLFAYSYFKFVGVEYTLVSIGLISFAGVAQFAPSVLGGLYWKGGTKRGAMAGLIAGFIIWAYCLPFPTLAKTHIIGSDFLEQGLFGLSFLRPHALFGLENWDPVSVGTFWSLLFNTGLYVGVSLFSRQEPLEIAQADLFVHINRYRGGNPEVELLRREGDTGELINLLRRFVGPRRTRSLLRDFEKQHNIRLGEETRANEDFVRFVETNIAGSIGAASARTVILSMVREDPISLDEMFQILDQTREIFQYSQALEQKSAQLEATTTQLREANDRLQELDRMKADFITTVTHELRTPITAIKSLAGILRSNPDLPEDQRSEYLEILVTESDRLARLVNQVLDLERLSEVQEDEMELLDLSALVDSTYSSLKQYLNEQQLDHKCKLPESAVFIRGNADRLRQVVLNLLSNAAKFADPEAGKIRISLRLQDHWAELSVRDNGIGIDPRDAEMIFQRFSQLNNQQKGKPRGTGLGLSIAREVVHSHGGKISVKSRPGQGATFIVRLPANEEH